MLPYHQKEQLENLPSGDYCFYCLQPNPRKIIGPQQILYECLQCGKIDGLKIKLDPQLKLSWHNNEAQHFTIGALLKNLKTGKYLIMKKRTYPFFLDIIAGHIKTEETPEQTLLREVKEETGITIQKYKKIWDGMIEGYPCRRGALNHYWYIFLATFDEKPIPHIQEVSYFKEYAWEEILNEKMLNPPLIKVFAGFNTSLLTT